MLETFTEDDIKRAYELGKMSGANLAKDAAKPYARSYILRKLSGQGYNITLRAKQKLAISIYMKIKDQPVPSDLIKKIREK